METHMDAEAKKAVLDNAFDRLVTGGDVMPLLAAVFDAGYGHGLRQGRYDRDAEKYGVEGGGEVMPTLYVLQFRLPGRDWMDGTSWLNEVHMPITPAQSLEQHQAAACPGEEWRLLVAHPQLANTTFVNGGADG